jgi:HAMP domain-containing protein
VCRAVARQFSLGPFPVVRRLNVRPGRTAQDGGSGNPLLGKFQDLVDRLRTGRACHEFSYAPHELLHSYRGRPDGGGRLSDFSTDRRQRDGQAHARANGIATAAASLYVAESAAARAGAETVARATALLNGPGLGTRIATVATRAALARLMLMLGPRVIADVGDNRSVAPGVATVRSGGGGEPFTVTASTLTASEYARDLAGSRMAVLVRQGGRTLGSTLPAVPRGLMPRQGTVTAAGVGYRAVTQTFAGFGAQPVHVTVLSNLSATVTSIGASRLVAAVFIGAFLLLAVSFSALASRALQGQVNRFLEAARRLGSGDFSSTIPTEGHDEFAALGEEFNNMSSQLAHRLDELSQERAKLRQSIRRIGHTFAANLDRPALLAARARAPDCGRRGSGWLRSSERP